LPKDQPKPRVGLFVTCLVDFFRPSVGFAAVKLLEDAGCTVTVPVQTCCGQPAFNSGDRATARTIALQVMKAFADCDYAVAPSGSCAGMLAKHYEELFADAPDLLPKVRTFAAKCHELVSFLVDVRRVTAVQAKYPRRVTYHDSCSSLRELGIRAQPRQLLDSVEGLERTELPDAEICCGFGGAFAVKYGEISNAIVEKKAQRVVETGVPVLLAADLGCLLNIAGKLSRQGHEIEVRHVAEVLAGMTDTPPIGAPAAISRKSSDRS
jgi:L-lactate dehydrogenase complex protein LldE